MHNTISKEQILKLRRAIRRRGCSWEDAEDVVQEAFLRAGRYDGSIHNFDGLVFVIASNLATIQHRRSQIAPCVSVPDEMLLDITDPSPTPEHALALESELHDIQVRLDSVSVKTRQIFFAHRAGFDYREISSALGVSLRTIEKHIRRAMLLVNSASRDPSCR